MLDYEARLPETAKAIVPCRGRHRDVSLALVWFLASMFTVMKRKIPCIAALVTCSGIEKIPRYHLINICHCI
jgi:hypothetical protein